MNTGELDAGYFPTRQCTSLVIGLNGSKAERPVSVSAEFQD